MSDSLLASPAAQQWQQVGTQPRHGVVVPLFSIRSQASSGIGEYLDLIPLIDWCAAVGFSVIQLLPLNDSGSDPSPYSALSANALNPLHLSLQGLPDTPDSAALTPLRNTPRVDYAAVRQGKLAILQQYVEQHGAAIQQQPDYQQFVQEQEWLLPFAHFKALRQLHGGSAWWDWPPTQPPPPSDLSLIVQFFCDQQLRLVREHAEAKGVLLMGDMPILVSPNSSDVWQYQDYFDRSLTVGSPPDQYSEAGQNWGFPAYQWRALAADDYHWWRKRLQFAQRHFHLYRLDHVVGFFRLWVIPAGKTGREGRFIPIHLAEALAAGRERLTMLLAGSSMLPIGEDLGAVPTEVRQEMTRLGICGTKVMRWERRWEGDKSFIPVDQYQPLSLTCVSTHDSEPLKLWWSEHPAESQQYAVEQGWEWEPTLSREHHRALLRSSHQSGSLFHINPLGEYLAQFDDLVHANPQEERINVPGTTSPRNWTYRFKPTVEQLIADSRLAQLIGELLS